MLRSARFQCPLCGRKLPGNATDPTQRPVCNECGRLGNQWCEAPVVVAGPPVVARIPPLLPSPAPLSAPSLRRWIVVAIVLAVTGLGAAGYWYLREERVREQAAANRLVAAKVEAARAHLARGDFDQAFKAADDAVATENATTLDDARLTLLQARQGQANLLLDLASTAVAQRNSAQAHQFLSEYLAHPYADRKPRAKVLLEELTRASSADSASRLLAQLPDEQLTAFAETGRLSDGETFTDAGMRDLYLDTLRHRLPEEQRIRARRRAAASAAAQQRAREQKDREERIRVAPAYQELIAFAATVRRQAHEQDRRREQEERALQEFFRHTGVNDPAERAKARETLRAERGVDNGVLILRKKADVKKDFRASKDHDPADVELFDRLVDLEVDRLLADVKAGNKP